MSTINYAIEITTDATTVTDANYGCVGGVFRFITGRPGYDGNAPYPTGETGVDSSSLTAHWFEGWVIEDGIGGVTRSIDVTISGDYGTMSDCSFKLVQSKATDRFWKFVEDNDIYFTNKKVTVYCVIGGKFYFAWTGAISNNPYNDIEFTFQCIDQFRSVHTEIPPVPVTASTYSESEDGSSKVVPISIGDIPRANLVNITGDPEWIDVLDVTNTVLSDNNTMTLKSFPMTYWSPQWNVMMIPAVGHTQSIVDNFSSYLLFPVEGISTVDKDIGYKIKAAAVVHFGTLTYNGVPLPGDAYLDGEIVTLVLYDNIGIHHLASYSSRLCYNPSTIVNGRNITLPSSDAMWYKLGKLNIQYKISSGDIGGLLYDSQNVPLIYTWDDTDGYVRTNTVLSGVDYSNGIITLTSRRSYSQTGEVKTLRRVPFTITYCPYYFAGSDVIDKITDVDRTTYWQNTQTFSRSSSPGSGMLCPQFDATCVLDDNFDYSKYSNIYIGLDMSVISATSPYWFRIQIQAVDVFGYAIGSATTFDYPNGDAMNTGSDYLNTLHSDYYVDGTVGTEDDMFWSFTNLKSKHTGEFTIIQESSADRIADKLKIPQVVLDGLKSGVARGFNVKVYTLTQSSVNSWTSTFRLKEFGVMGLTSSELLTDNMYVAISGELDDLGAETNNVYGAMRHLMVNYDKIPEAQIDFGNLKAMRQSWHVGRQITERKSSFNYLQELCKHSFVSIVPKRNGHRKCTAWLEDTTTPTDFTTDTILRGSIGGVEKTSLSKAYTDYFVEYSWDPGKKRFMRSFFITNAKAASFPAITEAWTEYAGGFPNNAYADAKELWNKAHEGYKHINAVTPKLPDAYSKLWWYIDPSLYGLPASHTGTASSAYKYLRNLAEWSSIQKDVVKFSVPITTANIALELLQPIRYQDQVTTGVSYRDGWITSIVVDAKENRINLTAIIMPYYSADMTNTLIVERGTELNTDTITERGTSLNTDTYTETGV